MLPAPVGYVHLFEAVDVVGRSMHGAGWIRVCCQESLRYEIDVKLSSIDDVLLTIAEACEAGTLAAAFQHLFKGADELDRSVWRKAHWRNFFATGTTLVDQPVLLMNNKEDPSGATIPCERKIFIRKDTLGDFTKLLAPAVKASRYPGDEALIKEGREMVAAGMEKRAAARKLAARAEGAGTFESKVDRLRKAL